MNSTFNLLRRLLQGILTSRILCLCFLFLCISDSGSAQELLSSPLLHKEPENLGKDFNLQEMVSLSIQLNKKTIQASSLEDKIFPMLISSKINKIEESSFARNPVDLVCVFEIENHFHYRPSTQNQQIQDIQNLFKHLLPLMTDQDRLAVVLFYNPSYVDNLLDVIDSLPITKIPSLTNTTTQNWETIIETIGEKIVQEGMSTERALKAAMKILNQRNETNRTTGVFISAPHSEDTWDFEVREDRTMEEIEWIKEDLGLQAQRWIIKTFQGGPRAQNEIFAESLTALRAGVIETKFLLKAEESGLLKGADIKSTYSRFLQSGKWSFKEDGALSLRIPSLKSGQEEFFFDLKILKITQDLPANLSEVKVASYQAIFVLEDGSQVAKNADLTVKIVGKGENFVEEEEDQDVVRSFYRKWGEDWLLRTAWEFAFRYNYEYAKKLLKTYKESLDDSVVKDDEMLQNMWKETEKRILEDEESGIIRCW